MKNHHWAWLALGAALVASAGVNVAACSSSDSGTGNPTSGGGGDASRDGTTSGDDGSTTGDDGGGGGSDAGADCSKVPKLHPEPDAGVYCPFQADSGAGASSNCAANQHCCIYAQDAGRSSECLPNGTLCFGETMVDGGLSVATGGADFECNEPGDCPSAGDQCCLNGTPTKDPTCGTYFGSKVHGAFCKPSCTAGEFVICETQTECTTGTCTPFSTKTIQIGACVQ